MILNEGSRIQDVLPYKELDLLANILNRGDVLQARPLPRICHPWSCLSGIWSQCNAVNYDHLAPDRFQLQHAR